MATSSAMMALGTEAPPFDLPDPTGGRHRFDERVGDAGLLVMFICNHCPYVKHVQEPLARLAEEWMENGLGVVAINSNDVSAYPDDSPPRMAEVAERIGYPFPYLFDEDQSVARAYGAVCTPDFFLFDRDHRLVYRGRFDHTRPGGATPATGADLAAAVALVLTGETPPADQAPSMGCSIKWKPGNEPM
ncbi:MAG: thioredoxin family protein [Actinomycetota bacterium]|nr:thioredoxin family protein [Actinomycetota bacterium]